MLNGQLREPFQGACVSTPALGTHRWIVRIGEHFLTTKRGETELVFETRLTSFSGRSAQDTTTGDRVHLRLCQSSGWSVVFPA